MWFEVFAAFLSLLVIYYLCRMADDIHAGRKALERIAARLCSEDHKPDEPWMENFNAAPGGQSGIVMRNYPLK